MSTTADEQAPPESTLESPSAAPTTPADIRAGRPYLFGRTPLRAFVRRLASICALVAIDVCGLALGLYVALVLRWLAYEGDLLWGFPWQAVESWLPFLALITVLVFWQAGLYAERDRRAGIGRVLSSLLLVAVLTLVFAWGSGHDFNTYGLAPVAVITSALIIGLLRASYEVITGDLLRKVGVRRRAVLVGAGENLSHLRRALGESRVGIEYEFVDAVGPDRVVDVLGATRVDELIVNAADIAEQDLLELVEQAHRRGVQVRVAPTTTELLTQRAEYIPGQAVPLFELRPPAFTGIDWALKRSFDLAVATLLLVVGLPAWLLIAAAIRLDSRGPVLYRDRRVGLGENEFGMLKFRTMYVDAADQQRELEAANEASGALFKIRDDPRVTRVGAFLRRFSLDEIPQVLNVLRGEMSLVGPRPLPVRDFAKLEPWHRKRYLVLPGMTGLWQISGRSSLTFDDLVRLDFYYLENWSIWLDVTILLKTVPAVLAQRGAY